jgi:hypothetical protein
MAKMNSRFKKKKHPVHMEDQLRKILVRESIAAGCISHPAVGFSLSEIARRFIKGRLLQLRPYIKESAKDVDWSEAI